MLEKILIKWTEAWLMYKDFISNGMYMALFFCALFYIFHTGKESRERKVLLPYSILVFAAVINPVTYYIAVKFFFEADVYWRMFWLLPINLVLAYAAVHLAGSYKAWKQWAVIAVLITVIAFSGKNVYTADYFTEATNLYKLPQEVVDVCEALKDEKEGGNEVKVVPAPELATYMRQCDAQIKTLYGRNALRSQATEEVMIVYTLLGTQNFDFEVLTTIARGSGYDYFIMDKLWEGAGGIVDYGYELIAETGRYDIYKDINVQ